MFGKKMFRSKLPKIHDFAKIANIPNFAKNICITVFGLHQFTSSRILDQYLILLQRYGGNKLLNKCCVQSAILNQTTLKNNSAFQFKELSIMLIFQVIPIIGSLVIVGENERPKGHKAQH